MFKINNYDWNLIFVDPFDPVLEVGNNKYTYGVTIPKLRTIFIANDVYGDFLHHILSHELWHAEMVSRNVYLPIYIEEALADLVADNELETINIARNVHNNLCKYYNKC